MFYKRFIQIHEFIIDQLSHLLSPDKILLFFRHLLLEKPFVYFLGTQILLAPPAHLRKQGIFRLGLTKQDFRIPHGQNPKDDKEYEHSAHDAAHHVFGDSPVTIKRRHIKKHQKHRDKTDTAHD